MGSTSRRSILLRPGRSLPIRSRLPTCRGPPAACCLVSRLGSSLLGLSCYGGVFHEHQDQAVSSLSRYRSLPRSAAGPAADRGSLPGGRSPGRETCQSTADAARSAAVASRDVLSRLAAGI